MEGKEWIKKVECTNKRKPKTEDVPNIFTFFNILFQPEDSIKLYLFFKKDR